ncbi:MAG: glycosyltransferase [Methylococcaceae bacterium]|jgi:GT2 family glycosyltransferase/glycosyltransferase involved in cell wall biosynthesis
MQFREKVKTGYGGIVLGSLWLLKLLSKPIGLYVFYISLVVYLVKRSQLFDRAYYLDTNADVAEAGIFPLRHYVMFGDKEGRQPMALFDPVYYRSQVEDKTAKVNALLHYAYIGRFRKISPSPWFDVQYYLANNKDIARSRFDPLHHYLKWGGIEGRSPCPQFDGSFYLRTYPDVLEMRVNPLIHYLFYGRLEGRQTLPEQGNLEQDTPEILEPPLLIPDESVWLTLTPPASNEHCVVDVILPVYKGRAETLRCLLSVLSATNHTPFELIVINDASPEPELVADLHWLAERQLFTLLSNSENRGFVLTVNRGMRLHKTRDVILLNSDTEVYDGWLDRLHQSAISNKLTGTVTPLSNNATICSYPQFLHDNPYPLELNYAELDTIAAEVNAAIEVEAPTGVGFCMYIKRSCLNAVGYFDEKAFGKGYGEENDFCQRAIKKGWRNVIAANIFVRHLGAASFQGEKAKRVQAALKVLNKRYPHYQKSIDDFIAADSLREARCHLDSARMQRMRREQNVLIVCHNRGGGSERRMQEDIAEYTRLGYGVFTLRPVIKRPALVFLGHPAIKSFPNINPFVLAELTALTQALKGLHITRVLTHSLVDYQPDASDYLHSIINELGALWTVNLHDYKVICPRINLADENGVYCGEPSEADCNQCLVERGSDFNVLDIQEWRAVHRRALVAANEVLVPDDDVAERLLTYFPDVQFSISPHEAIDLSALQITPPRLVADNKLRIVVIGAIGKLKGFHVIISCAKQARQQNLPLEFIVMGYTMNDRLMEEAGVHVTGKYLEHEALDKLNALSPHVSWLPSLWPETYSYTFSLALKANLSVFAFDIGAIARRAKDAGQSDLLMPLSWADSPAKINHQFEIFRKNCLLND